MPKSNFINSKLFQALQLLTPVECKRLENWLNSHWPSHNKRLSNLLQLILIYYPHFSHPDLTRKHIFKGLFPQKKLDTNQLASLMAKLLYQVESFLVHERIRKDNHLKDKLLAQEYLDRGATEWALKKQTKVIKALEQKEIKNWNDLSDLCFLYESLHRQAINKNIRSNKQPELFKADYYLDSFYKLGKYRFLLEYIEREKILEENHPIEDKIASILTISTDKSPTFDIYQKYINLRNSDNKKTFDSLEKILISHLHEINHLDQSILLLFLINIGARVRLKGNLEVMSNIFNLYQIGIEKNLLCHNNRISTSTFANVVTLGNLLGDFKYVESFIKQHSSKLPKDIQEDALIWATVHSLVKGKRKQNDKVFKKLYHVQSLKSTFLIRARVLWIQMWFEDFKAGKEKDVKFMLDTCEAFMHQLRRSKLYAPERLSALRKFVKFTKDLIRIIDRKQLQTKRFFDKKNEIITESNIHAKKWLLQQFE